MKGNDPLPGLHLKDEYQKAQVNLLQGVRLCTSLPTVHQEVPEAASLCRVPLIPHLKPGVLTGAIGVLVFWLSFLLPYLAGWGRS